MSIFDTLKTGQNTPNTENNIKQAVDALKSNPYEILKQRGFTVPTGMNDPRQIVNHLLQTGQITNPKLQMAQRMLGMR